MKQGQVVKLPRVRRRWVLLLEEFPQGWRVQECTVDGHTNGKIRWLKHKDLK